MVKLSIEQLTYKYGNNHDNDSLNLPNLKKKMHKRNALLVDKELTLSALKIPKFPFSLT